MNAQTSGADSLQSRDRRNWSNRRRGRGVLPSSHSHSVRVVYRLRYCTLSKSSNTASPVSALRDGSGTGRRIAQRRRQKVGRQILITDRPQEAADGKRADRGGAAVRRGGERT